MDLLVLAKEPVAGRVKTRLTPPCTPTEAAAIAEAALIDTLREGLRSRADRVVLGLDGAAGPWCPERVEVVGQGSGELADRLETLWSHTDGPALQVGMDTPQLDAELLDAAMDQLDRPGVDAVLGLAEDGGWWGLGLVHPVSGCFAGIATSRPDTGARQLDRLRSLGLRVSLLPLLQDIDRWDDAISVAPTVPSTRFADAVHQVATRLGSSTLAGVR